MQNHAKLILFKIYINKKSQNVIKDINLISKKVFLLKKKRKNISNKSNQS
jgi:hypothetical protein